ncbi:MAG: hypothetical protein N2C13_00635 [Chloroflexota bacterium]
MSTRPFSWRDVSTLHRYRKHGLFLDSIPSLTWGHTLVPTRAIFSPLSAAAGIFTSVYSGGSEGTQPMIGQVVHTAGTAYAHFTFLAPDTAIDSPDLQPLLEDLTKRVGGRGAQSVIAEVDETTTTFEALRKAGFSIYARQSIWRFTQIATRQHETTTWRRITDVDQFAARTLYYELVPALVKQVEPAPRHRSRGQVNFTNGKLHGYASVASGPNGIWTQPFIHPESERTDIHLGDLLRGLRPRAARPVYVSVRSYQGWLEQILRDLGGEEGPRQAVMVKRTAHAQKAAETYKLPAVEGGWSEITTPISPPAVEPGSEGILVGYEQTPENG